MCVYVRELTQEEGNKLLHLTRRGSTSFAMRRALILLASAQKMKVPEIARSYQCGEDHVRDVLHQFNKIGWDSLKPNYGGGRKPTFTEEQRSMIIQLAQMPPRAAGMPFTQWSLSKLANAAVQKGIVKTITAETVRVILDKANITYQNTKTWKSSKDPEFEVKKNASNRSTKRHPPTDV
ncbi:helix-turn-helix domain-containing protein [Heliophilum fasciatum]|uniref:Transposase n=1 Tax=Heliophilum fasciatum TaxID=35700 RepID=A0A4R2RE32_9FIRM|nr:helix-turn-helix domain-containing protein [Heliophilum fasciatum]MCW2279014.1 transposase [Heliophilum fasciatum]TCP61750.1 transposase [Heliophilum fasciatum]